MKRLSLLMLAALMLSCGQSKEEKARLAGLEKVKQDSLIKAVEYATQQRIERKQRLQDSVHYEAAVLEGLKNRMILVKAELDAARDKLMLIKQPQFLRTPEEREEQIRNQNIRISSLENEAMEIQARAQETALHLDQLKFSLQALSK